MQFLYHSKSKEKEILLENDDFHYIFNVRRNKVYENLKLANMLDSTIYIYKIKSLMKKQALLELLDSNKIVQNNPHTHIIQAVIDMSEFQKSLFYLNELFVEKITFFYGDFSQRNEKINLEKLRKIIIHSSMQCGRLNLMQLEIKKDLKEVLQTYNNAIALDFCDKKCNFKNHNSFIIGPEGGFSNKEKKMLEEKSFGTNNPLIMRAKTAAIFIAANKI